MVNRIARSCLVTFILLSSSAFAGKLDALLEQREPIKVDTKQRTAKEETFNEYRMLLSAQLDSTGRLMFDRFQYEGRTDLLAFTADSSLDDTLAQTIYSDYKIPMGCIGGGDIFRPIIANLLTATYAKNEAIKQNSLAGLNRGLEERRIWIESGERNTPGLCRNSNKQFRQFLDDLLVWVQDAPQEAIRIKKSFAEQRDTKQREQVALQRATKEKEERAKVAKVEAAEAAKAEKQRRYEQCSKQFSIPIAIAQRLVNFYGGPVELCGFVLSARDAGVKVTYSKNIFGFPYTILLKKSKDSISFDLAVPEDIAIRDAILLPMTYSINGDKQHIESQGDATRLALNILALTSQK